jgi:LPS export ABC transporter protein LptC
VVLILHTQRLSRGILVAVALFVVIVAGILIARGRAVRPESADRVAMKADFRVKDVNLREEARGGVTWLLQAEQAEAFEATGKTTLKKVRITIDEPGRNWVVTGDEGEMTQASKDIELRGNVVLVSSDGLRLETARLRWAAADQRAWTDDPVTVYRSGAVVKGTGLEARVGEQATEIKGRVQAVFNGRAGKDKAADTAPAGLPGRADR